MQPLAGIPGGESIASMAGGHDGGTTRLVAVTVFGSSYPGIAGDSHGDHAGVYTLDVGGSWQLRTTGISGGNPFFGEDMYKPNCAEFRVGRALVARRTDGYEADASRVEVYPEQRARQDAAVAEVLADPRLPPELARREARRLQISRCQGRQRLGSKRLFEEIGGSWSSSTVSRTASRIPSSAPRSFGPSIWSAARSP